MSVFAHLSVGMCAQNSGTSAGSLWWMDRELEDAKKYMPKVRPH